MSPLSWSIVSFFDDKPEVTWATTKYHNERTCSALLPLATVAELDCQTNLVLSCVAIDFRLLIAFHKKKEKNE
jgi:hypothetical protein